MLDSRRTFKIKVKSPWTVFKLLLTSVFIYTQEFLMEMRLSDIFKTINVTKMTKAILESS